MKGGSGAAENGAEVHLVGELEVRVVLRRRAGGGAGVDHRGDAAHEHRVRHVWAYRRLLRAGVGVTSGSGGAAALRRVLAGLAVLGLR